MKIYTIKGTLLNTNNYLIEHANYFIIVEASANLDAIKKITKNKKVLAIFLTHGHWDHYINLEELENEYKCNIFMSEEAYLKIIDKKKAFSIDKNPKISIDKTKIKFIKDNQEIKFKDNLSIKCIHTPGHTNCSFSYILKENNKEIFFSGDFLFKDGLGRTDLPTGNKLELTNSIRRVLKEFDNIDIYCGHGETTTLEKEKTYLKQII